MHPDKTHWETVYETKTPEQVSWTQAVPTTSLNFIKGFGLDKSARVIDIGGGDSRLVDFLLEAGYTDITVLDISGAALERTKKRLGARASQVTWIESNILDFNPTTPYDIWHDRAAFHFLVDIKDIARYLELTRHWVSQYMILGTFSDRGPKKCSGLDITQYSESGLVELMNENFEKLEYLNEDHRTPFDTIQNFTFCSFRRNL